MFRPKLLVDTNVIIDCLSARQPHAAAAELLFVGGYAGEFDLWASASQFTDLVYILSQGGKPALVPGVLERLRAFRSCLSVCSVGAGEVDSMLASTWEDPEDALMMECALRLHADAVITRNKQDFAAGPIPAMTCEEFFAWMEREHRRSYALLNPADLGLNHF